MFDYNINRQFRTAEYPLAQEEGGIDVKMNFKIGENVFMTAGNRVMEARVECPQYGRYVVAYKGSGYEAEGRICVSGTRLFHAYDEAMANIRKITAHA